MVSLTVDANASRPTAGMISPRHVRSRTQSISSDRPSTVGYGLVLPPVSISPPASFIASSAASQIITNDHDSHADAWYDQNGIDPATETAIVSAPALQLVNSFLDQLLFNFLQVSKSTALSDLRPAVIEVLKPKLGKDAVSNADEELREYLGGANEDYEQLQGVSSPRNWDGELVWKRTRLRCMVYSSLGDMEEEDEDVYMEEENLEIGVHEQISDTISPAVAIFLTSVIEYMGELTLTVAGQAAYQRVRSKIERELKDGARNTNHPADRIVVTDLDMERVALDRTLGRLWRGWKKRMRTPTSDRAGSPFLKGPPTPCRPDQMASGYDVLSLHKSATSDPGSELRNSQEHAQRPIAEDVQPEDIPLPVRDNDVDEIEVPGLAHHSDDEGDDEMDDEEVPVRKRPKSLLISSSIFTNGLPTPTKSQPHTPIVATRQRSTSVPTPRVPHFFPKTQRDTPASAVESEADQDTLTEIGVAMTTKEDKSVSETNAKSIAISGVPATKDVEARSQSSESDYDDAEEVAYEKAEIMTTSRVSMSSNAHSTDSDSNSKTTPLRRSSSVHSARIIDVPAPRSPAHSRPTSMDAAERPCSVSLSGVASGLAKTAISDDRLKVSSNESITKTVNGASLPRSSHERRKPPASSTAPISEHDEEASQNLVKGENQPGSLPNAAEMAAAGSTSSSWSRRKKGLPVTLNTKIQSSKYEQSPVSARTIPLPATPATPDIEEEDVPNLPIKASGHSGWSSPKPEPKGLLSIERTRTHESDELSLPAQQQNTSGSRQVSQAHTAASSVSSGASRLKPVRTSEDGSSRSESVARNFEELIQSNQTITYTLTPENMRDIDARRSLDSPVVTKFARRKSEDARTHQHSPKAPQTLTHSTVGNLPSPRLPPSPTSPKIVESKAIVKPAGPVPRAPTTTVSTVRAIGNIAREARVPSDSTSDFAEFIKSTGPADETRLYTVPKLGSPPASSDRGLRESRRASAASSINRSRYQPREATVDSRTDNSDLIDFIRQGPPIAASNHRIPRHIAPFRTTMDSDQMSGAIGGKAIDANIPDIRSSRTSTSVTESSMPSMQSSVNSRSALIRNQAPKIPNKLFDDDDENMMPKRKTRRVRDPYAIDFSDEEQEAGQDDHILDTPKLPVKKEESLAEFLRNYEPPPEPVSAPAPRLPRKKASAPSLIGRFTRSGKDKEKEKEKDSASIQGMPEFRSVSRASSGRGYIPIQVNIPPGYDEYGPINGRIGANRARGTSTTSSTAGRIPMKKYEPREAASKQSETAELAAFFRDSSPPRGNSPVAITRRSSQHDDSGGLAKMFGRRKKSLAL